MDDFLLRALLAGFGLAAVAGPLGSFVVWRRMAYFGDTLAHSALLGVALGFLIGLNVNLGILLVCGALAVLLVVLRSRQRLADDTILGIMAHSTLSLGLVSLAFLEHVRVDLMAYLFGDILAVGPTELWWIWLGGLAVLGVLALIWRPLLTMTLHEELARAEGVPLLPMQLLFMGLMAGVIAIAMNIVGILLVTSLLIIPAATARLFARTPEQMAVLASLLGCLAVAGGLRGSWNWDLPTGPAIVVTATLLFTLAMAATSVWQALRGDGGRVNG
ncbi:metal ABC transporter permease [Alkalilimnicola ehrlichii MLHE-1]|uniref:High-affinity zinc uptake system membrane protein ZnuB n=1 Tax=Alkalilimnicola ehrlichii (strain ATCC BAA-1101 / DSM 17681 / MLHE-1) TaxID=187272 RepID=Q0A9E1_ALKEH|nr:iron chelate uptake ABC transporter family permease subunit [Alkalilimnicola ehrlichii]ABI56546.1 ABC-3 protein [Alkalilimnicola ehrlichii MLHE-1]